VLSTSRSRVLSQANSEKQLLVMLSWVRSLQSELHSTSHPESEQELLGEMQSQIPSPGHMGDKEPTTGTTVVDTGGGGGLPVQFNPVSKSNSKPESQASSEKHLLLLSMVKSLQSAAQSTWHMSQLVLVEIQSHAVVPGHTKTTGPTGLIMPPSTGDMTSVVTIGGGCVDDGVQASLD